MRPQPELNPSFAAIEGFDPTLKIWTICRGDISGMESGNKAGAMAAHAFRKAWDDFLSPHHPYPDHLIAPLYEDDGSGFPQLLRAKRALNPSIVILKAKRLKDFERALEMAQGSGLPFARHIESGHVIPGTDFDGRPILTSFGIGPCRRDQAREITKRFQIWKD